MGTAIKMFFQWINEETSGVLASGSRNCTEFLEFLVATDDEVTLTDGDTADA